MKRFGDLPDVIAVFPLPGALLLPRSRLPLHIFEPRYLAMIDDCLRTPHRLIGMIQPRDLPGGRGGETGEEKRLQAIGCAGRLTGFSETEDGRYMISLTGVSRFRIGDEALGFTPYRRFHIDWAPFGRDMGPAETDAGFRREPFLDLLRRYFEAMQLSTDWGSLTAAEDELLINSLSMLCPFSPEDKQALLEAPSLETRRETLVTLIEFALHAGPGEETMQ
ncbi:LON peptidase substrate-binding domain-containing protein [Ruixingdingia sedimenti]|uniref:LON peptidase substrate-binding domain-containing protein n=1 Tax=Ruixingdingia sedimenti TaxID=3073604 RepID=A0ABU1F7I0_9RHOB|nr:LON peptidase substrate-binding domain-containing protein [Xinfangfangia sp. LG-4]MDR5652404.1 LON peptidase substrate-binding domain-containing protein [Xinfangfangia sp. LG-4]